MLILQLEGFELQISFVHRVDQETKSSFIGDGKDDGVRVSSSLPQPAAKSQGGKGEDAEPKTHLYNQLYR